MTLKHLALFTLLVAAAGCTPSQTPVPASDTGGLWEFHSQAPGLLWRCNRRSGQADFCLAIPNHAFWNPVKDDHLPASDPHSTDYNPYLGTNEDGFPIVAFPANPYLYNTGRVSTAAHSTNKP